MSSVMIAMSGGVDSSVAAYLMKQNGYNCVGGTMLLCNGLPEYADSKVSQGAQDAAAVAADLGIEFHLFDESADFREMVVKPFIQCYEDGGTPNPCVNCNRHLKFDVFLEKALSLGYDCIATGHYAQIRKDEQTGRYLLYRADDSAKDQTYFLACLNQHQLAHTRFPLGELTKEQVRQIAEEQGFVNAVKRDSQDICFIPDGDYKAFMESYTGRRYPGGNYLDLSGNVVGQHEGAVGYTIGQRKGLGIAMGEPVYVCAKDMANNTVTVGPDSALFRTTLLADNWNWIPFPTLDAPIRVNAKVRYRHKEQPATVYPEKNGICRVVFDEPQRAITAGQAVVLYQDDLVVGSGTITQTL